MKKGVINRTIQHRTNNPALYFGFTKMLQNKLKVSRSNKPQDKLNKAARYKQNSQDKWKTACR